MNLLKTSLLAVALICLVTSCQKDEEPVAQEAHYSIDLNLAKETDWDMANNILILINEHRTAMGLPILVSDQQYASAYAVDHTKYMIKKEKLSHDNFYQRRDALKAQGALMVGENVAYGYDSAESVVTAWLNSPGHRKIIEGEYTHCGFGILPNERGTYYFTQLFYRK